MHKFGWQLTMLALVTIWAAVLTLPDNNLHVVFCRVGEGDATLIFRKTTQLLVDGGPDNSVLACLAKYMPFYDHRIEAVILTHANADHSKGLEFVRKRYNIGEFEPKLWKGDVLKMGGFSYEVLSPDRKVLGTNTVGKENDEGIVGEIKLGEFETLLTADAATKDYAGLSGIEVVKVPHHGSKTDLDPGWWQKLRPKLAVISVGKNSFGHPTNEVIKLLSDLEIKTLRTDIKGDIEIITDGKKWWVK